MLQDKFKEYIEQSDVVKTLNADLKDAQQSHESYAEIERINKDLKDLKQKLNNVTEIALIKEKRDGAKERLGLLKELLMAEMAESGETEVEYQGKKAKIISTVKFEKAK